MVDMASSVREQIYSAIRAFTCATVAEAEAATKAVIRLIDNPMPDDGSCVRCGAAPRSSSGLCNTCLDEDAEREEGGSAWSATRRHLEAAIDAFAKSGIDFRAPWQCDLDDLEQERFDALVRAVSAVRSEDCEYAMYVCTSCGGEGRIYSGHPNDPDPRDEGECEACGGDGRLSPPRRSPPESDEDEIKF